jgi:xylose isomerase
VKARYSSFDSGIGAEIEAGKTDFKKLEAYILAKGDAAPNQSGRQEMLEHLFNRYI